MPVYLMTTTYPKGLLHSSKMKDFAHGVRKIYTAAAPSFNIVSSHVVGDKTVDLVTAASTAEANKGAAAIGKATKTKVEIVEAEPFSRHVSSL